MMADLVAATLASRREYLKNDNARVQAGKVTKQCETIANTLSYLRPTSVKGSVLGALLRGECLTHLDCLYRFGSARLSHHIYILRRIGWKVQMGKQALRTGGGRRVVSISAYALSPEQIAQAGKLGRRYSAICARLASERRAA